MKQYIIFIIISLSIPFASIIAQDTTADDFVNQNGDIVTDPDFNGSVHINTDQHEKITLKGPASSYTTALQDGTGRVQHYWNSTTGTSPKYLNSNEPAGKILFSPYHSDFYSIYYAPPGTANTNITWQKYLKLSNTGSFSIYKPGSATGNVHITSPDGQTGLIFTSNEPEKIRGDFYMTKDGFEIAPGTSTANPGTKMYINGNGNVGVGIKDATAKLHTLGTIKAGNYANETLEIGHGGSHGYINNIGDGNIDFRHEGSTKASILSNGVFRVNKMEPLSGALYLSGRAWGMVFQINTDGNGNNEYDWQAGGNTMMTLDSNRKMVLGTPGADDAEFITNGTIYAREVIVDNQLPTPDYVFEKNYQMLSIEEKAAYTVEQKHLPNVKSAKEMEHGVNVLELNYAMLQELEEAYKYIFQMNQQIKDQQTQIEEQKAINDKLAERQQHILKEIEALK